MESTTSYRSGYLPRKTKRAASRSRRLSEKDRRKKAGWEACHFLFFLLYNEPEKPQTKALLQGTKYEKENKVTEPPWAMPFFQEYPS